jgi:DNA-binding NtrC family response regulator
LSVVEIHVPPLAERKEDIPLLTRYFLDKSNRANQRQVRIRNDAIEVLTKRDWPGNVRELENVIERAAIFSRTGEITAEDLNERRLFETNLEQHSHLQTETLRDAEKEQISRALKDTGGNRTLAARRLGIERKTLYTKARRLGIDLGTKKS